MGTVRELVSRTLGRFQNEELITVEGRHIVIHSVKALKEFAEGVKK